MHGDVKTGTEHTGGTGSYHRRGRQQVKQVGQV